MQTKLERIAEISRYTPKAVFTSLYHLLNKDLLMECHRGLEPDDYTLLFFSVHLYYFLQ